MHPPKKRLSKLKHAEQAAFLLQHIPHRLCAVSTWLKLDGKWAMPPKPNLPNNDFHVWCIGRSVDEGRYAAMRWLTEFVGIKMVRNGRRAVRPQPIVESQFVSIQRFHGGRYFPLHTRSSAFLAKIWKGCTQASVHPTRATGHPDVSEPRMAEALVLILDHLESHLYQPNDLDLLHVMRTQEHRSNIRRHHPRDWVRRYEAALAELGAA